MDDIIGRTDLGIKLTEHFIDLTDWAKAVVSRKIPNYGLALKAKEENTGDTFYSSCLLYTSMRQSSMWVFWRSWNCLRRKKKRQKKTWGKCWIILIS